MRRHIPIFALALCAVCASPSAAYARIGLGGILGLLTAPLHAITGIGGHAHVRHLHGASARALARPEGPRQITRETAETKEPQGSPRPAAPTEPSPREAGLEPPRDKLPPATKPQAAAWPQASPSVYEDVVGYILLPHDYADRLWTHGYGDVVDAVLPAPATAAQGDQAARMIANGMCSSEAQVLANKPITRISETLDLAADQRAALDQLHAALGQAIERGRAALCGSDAQAGADRLKPMIDGLWTMWDATILMRGPLARFYDSLTPEQKAKLTDAGPAHAKAAGACEDQRAANGPAERLQQAMGFTERPSEQQRRSLEALRQRLTELAQFLATSCPQESEPTPIKRLTAAGERMNALLYAVMNMGPAMAEFQAAPESQARQQGAHRH
jgi:LTXXQ motif family protein